MAVVMPISDDMKPLFYCR